jgi:peptide deformylase
MTPDVVVEDLSKLSIIQFPDPRLELVAELIPVEGQDAAKKLADRMLELMSATRYGWGLAATQVAVPWRLFVMQIPKIYAGEPKRWLDPERGTPFLFANPAIMRVSENTVPLNEGCLSFPGVTERIERPETLELCWTDVHTWTPKVELFGGWEARVIQHEMDHLDGRNLIDHLSPVAQKKMRKRALAGRRL